MECRPQSECEQNGGAFSNALESGGTIEDATLMPLIVGVVVAVVVVVVIIVVVVVMQGKKKKKKSAPSPGVRKVHQQQAESPQDTETVVQVLGGGPMSRQSHTAKRSQVMAVRPVRAGSSESKVQERPPGAGGTQASTMPGEVTTTL